MPNRTTSPLSDASSFISEVRIWNNLRFRFGLLLALALLPWLILTVVEASTKVSKAQEARFATLDLVATATVRDAAMTLYSGVVALEAAPHLIESIGCEQTSQRLLSRLQNFTTFITYDETGGVDCIVNNNNRTIDFQPPGRIMDDTRGIVIDLVMARIGDEPSSFLRLSTANPEVNGSASLLVPRLLGMSDLLRSDDGPDLDLFITTISGEIIMGDPGNTGIVARAMSDLPDAQPTLIELEEDQAGPSSRVIVQRLDDLNLIVGVSHQREPKSFWDLIDPFSTVFLPVLAWFVGFGLIWLGTQSMIIKPLARVRFATRKFAQGRLDHKVKLSGSAAEEVHGLADAFNKMARDLDDRERRLADNIDEKDLLMREIHHRVKNNLQIIISLLNMQERKADNVETVTAIAETRARINAIAAVHYGLYESPDLRSVNIGSFLSRLIASLTDTLEFEDREIALRQEVDACELPADSAIPIALFIVEAVTNAATHGVERGGEVGIRVNNDQADELTIEISDDGKGIGDPSQMKGIGTRLMRGFARQLGGRLEFSDRQPGLMVRLSVPREKLGETQFRMSRNS